MREVFGDDGCVILGGGLCVEGKYHRDVNHKYMMLQSVETAD